VRVNARPLIVGAGPTGLSAALFLSLKGVSARIIDQAVAPAIESRAQVINPRALELLESTGVADAVLAEGHTIHRTRFYRGWKLIAELEFGDAHPRYRPTVLPQARTEALLTQALARRGLQPERGVRFESLRQNHDGVTATLVHPDGQREAARAPLLLGADGAHSHVREALGVGFAGSAFPEPWPLYDIHLDDPLDLATAHVSFVRGGLVFLLGLRTGLWRVFGNVPDPLGCLPPRAQRGAIRWHSSFHISHRLAAREASGHVALAGDAAHVHSPVAARGMNLGIEDAYVFAACAVDALNGHQERPNDFHRLRQHVHHSVIRRVRTLTELARGRPRVVGALRGPLLSGVTRFPPAAHTMVALLTGLDHDVRLH
jgi:2-polyprenyl-6-methoxyphenol hydroxylase-like FAD-dependent oxidoreductase